MSQPTNTVWIPPQCTQAKAFSQGCMPCPSDVGNNPTSTAFKTYTAFDSLDASKVQTFSANNTSYFFAPLGVCPIGGISNSGMFYTFAVCSSKIKASLLFMQPSANVLSTLQSYYAMNVAVPDVMRINWGDPTTCVPAAPGQVKSFSWNGEQTLASYLTQNATKGWAFNNGSATMAAAVLEGNPTPFHTSFCAIQMFFTKPSQLQVNLIAQGQQFSGTVIESGSYTIFQTQLGAPPSTVPSQTSYTDGSAQVLPVLVWTQDCGLLPETISSQTGTGDICNQYGCVESTSLQPPPVTSLSTLPGALMPQWNMKSYRTTALWVLAPLSSPPGPLPPFAPSQTSTGNCVGLNFLWTTSPGSLAAPNTFCACPPYTGSSSSMATSGILRFILGGQPLQTVNGNNVIPSLNNQAPNVQAPNLMALCDEETNLFPLLFKPQTASGIPQEGIFQYCDYSKTPIQMPQANFVTVDVAIIEENTGTSVRAWAVVKIIPGATTDNPYATQALPAFSATNHAVPITNLPMVTSKNWTSQANQPLAVAVIAMDQSPLAPNQARSCLVNVPSTTPEQYVYAQNYSGIPGAENVAPTATMVPPQLLARASNNQGEKFTYVYWNATFGRTGMPANTSITLQTVPIAQVVTQINGFGNASPVLPCLRLVLNYNGSSCAFSDGNDSWLPTTAAPYSFPGTVMSATVLLEFKGPSQSEQTVRGYVWLFSAPVSDASQIPQQAPDCQVQFPFNPLLKCFPNEYLYLYAHSPSASQFAQATTFATLADSFGQLGNLQAFPCPQVTSDPTLVSNQCRANVQSTSQFLVDSQLDPLDPVGVYNHAAAAVTRSQFFGAPLREAQRDIGVAHEAFSLLAEKAHRESFKPEAFMMQAANMESAKLDGVSQQLFCPNADFVQICAPAQSNIAALNYNYNSIATTCPIVTTFDPNVLSCLSQSQPCKDNNCAGEGVSNIAHPAGQCNDPSKCFLWLNTAPGMSRSCLNATQTSSTAVGANYLGPLMPGFTPDPAACALPPALGQSGCPSLGTSSTLCSVKTNSSTGMAAYTNPCYNQACPTQKQQSACGTSAAPYCDGSTPSCQQPTGAFYSTQTPCPANADFSATAYCTETVETPTLQSLENFGLIPFGQIPCAANLKATPTSSAVATSAKSNQVTCPQTTADEASWFQTVFACQPVEPGIGYLTNQFGEFVIPPPIASDMTGRSISVADVCANPKNPAYNQNGWSASCTPDSSKAIFSYTPPANNPWVGYIYPQACLEPTSQSITGSFDPTQKIPPAMNVQMSYCNSGDSTGSCANTMARFMVDSANPYYQPVAPASLAASGSGDVVICGVVNPSVWGSIPATGAPQLSDMTTYSMDTSAPQYDWANIFSSQASQQYATTGHRGVALPIYATSKAANNQLPSNSKYTMVVPNDANVMSMLQQQNVANKPLGTVAPQVVGITPWVSSQPRQPSS